MPTPSTLYRTVSPPPIRRNQPKPDQSRPPTPRPADIEAGEAHVGDPFVYWTEHLERSFAKQRRRHDANASPLSKQDALHSLREVVSLYRRHENDEGHLFVVHQHNHPIAGLHYDLRLQFSKDSALSFSVPYGLPGNPNSQRRGRLAVETRVHCLWNHLVESASPASGSLLIWDFGTYNVLPRKSTLKQRERDGQSTSESEPEDSPLPSTSTMMPQLDPAAASAGATSEPAKLRAAFQQHSMRIRLNGLRLPNGYTITLRLSNPTPPSAPHPAQDLAPLTPRKRKRPRRQMQTPSRSPSPSSRLPSVSSGQQDPKGIGSGTGKQAAEDEGVQIRAQNAYPGSTNDIGSVHQRQWFLTLDKEGSGFVSRKTETGSEWVEGEEEGQGFKEFFVMGAEVERSIVTGRTSEELFEDEEVKSFTARKSWRPVLE